MRPATLLTLAATLLAGTTATAADAPSFTKDVKPFLKTYCVECHGGDKTKAGLDLSTYDGLMKGGKKKVITAGKPDDSGLVKVLTGGGKQMPPKTYKSQPTAKEIDVIKAWIKDGAKDDTKDKSSALPLQQDPFDVRRLDARQ